MVFENSIVLTTVADFIDYAMAVVGILAAVYFVRFLLAVRETTAPDRAKRDAEWEVRGAAGREWIGKKYEKMKTDAEAAETKRKAEREKVLRERKVRIILSKVTIAYTTASDLFDSLEKVKDSSDTAKRDGGLSRAKHFINEIHDQMETANHILRRVSHHSTRGEHTYFTNMYNESGTILSMLEGIKSHLPASSSVNWKTDVQGILNLINKSGVSVMTNCDNLISQLNEYIEKGKP